MKVTTGLTLVALVCANVSTPARAEIDEHTLMDMQDEFELRQYGLDATSTQLRAMQHEMFMLRMQIEHERNMRAIRGE